MSKGRIAAASEVMFEPHKTAHVYQLVSRWEILNCALTTFTVLAHTLISSLIDRKRICIDGINIDLTLVVAEAVVMRFEFLILEKAITKLLLLNPSAKTLVHCDLNSEVSTYFEQSDVCKALNLFQVTYGTIQ